MSWSDPYAVLNISHGSSESEIRQAYKRALLLYHPDKNGQQTKTPERENLLTIDDVNEAYRQIRGSDPSDLDHHQRPDDTPCLFNEVVDLSVFEELELSNGSLKWVRDCRCGEKGYILHEEELILNGDADEIAVQCLGCSLWILVQYSTE